MFNHGVVTLVADKLKGLWLCIVYFVNCIRRPGRELPRPSIQPMHEQITTIKYDAFVVILSQRLLYLQDIIACFLIMLP